MFIWGLCISARQFNGLIKRIWNEYQFRSVWKIGRYDFSFCAVGLAGGSVVPLEGAAGCMVLSGGAGCCSNNFIGCQ